MKDSPYEMNVSRMLEMISGYSYDGCEIMRPFVGSKVEKGHPLFLIGESHYPPKGFIGDLTPKTWYSGNAIIDNDLASYLDTKDIISTCFLGGDYNHKPFSIWKNSANEIINGINESGLHLLGNLESESDVVKEVFSHVVFFNYFRRPASGVGETITSEQIDYDVANAFLDMMIDLYKPCGIVFLSRKAGSGIEHKICEVCAQWRWEYNGAPVVITAHPGCVWWNRRSRYYSSWLDGSEGITGRMLLCRYIKSIASQIEWLYG